MLIYIQVLDKNRNSCLSVTAYLMSRADLCVAQSWNIIRTNGIQIKKSVNGSVICSITTWPLLWLRQSSIWLHISSICSHCDTEKINQPHRHAFEEMKGRNKDPQTTWTGAQRKACTHGWLIRLTFQNCFVASFPAVLCKIFWPPGCSSTKSIFHKSISLDADWIRVWDRVHNTNQ